MRLHGVIELSLVPDAEDAHFSAFRNEAIERQVSGLAEGNYQLAQGRLRGTADQRMPRQNLDGFPNCLGGLCCGERILAGEEPDRPLEIVERAL